MKTEIFNVKLDSDESGALCVVNYEMHPLCLNKPNENRARIPRAVGA